MLDAWHKANAWEADWWGDCKNTTGEENKQLYYAEEIGIHMQPGDGGMACDLEGKSVLDIGGGPVSLLLKCINRGRSVVIDPCPYPEWTMERYRAAGIHYVQAPAEDIESLLSGEMFDEVWIYNVLQHVMDPAKILENAKRHGKIVRVFEWIHVPANVGHLHVLTQDFLEQSLGVEGREVSNPWDGTRAWVGTYPAGHLPPPIDRTHKMRFHLLGLAHTRTNRSFLSCAFTQKVYKLAHMLTDLGYEVIHYGADGADVPCEHVTVVPESIWQQCYGGLDWHSQFFRYSLDDAAYTAFNKNASLEINRRKRADDFVLSTFGWMHKPVFDAVNLSLGVESGVGYEGIFAKFRAFESYAWMHYLYGKTGVNDGSFYDAVIPNAFDPADFPLATSRDDYFLYLGRITARKGVHLAWQVCHAIGAKLIIAGQGNLAEVGLEDKSDVSFVGSIQDPRVRGELLGQAQCVLVPTQYIGPFEGVAVEAMMAGTPVLTTDWGAFVETVPHGGAGYRCRTMDDFIWGATHLDRLWSPAQIQQYAQNNYSLDRVALMYQEYFLKLHDLMAAGFYELHPERTELDWLRRV